MPDKMSRLTAAALDAVRLGPGFQGEDARADGVIRRNVSSVRRLDLVGLAGGAGCSHLAARVAVLLARRRGTRVLGADCGQTDCFTRLTGAVHAGQRGQAAQQPSPVPVRRSLHPPVSVNSVDEATAALLTGRAGLRVARPDGGPARTARPEDWRSQVEPVLRFFDVVVTDWGNRRPGIDFAGAIRGSHAVGLVCRADRPSVETAASVARAVNNLT
ncbi:MAG: hypothetical protein LBI84_01060, partial [Propionibacteriaceae bacterium]|nr:hypothetical protein [Propionibacteriaceae bacterium]